MKELELYTARAEKTDVRRKHYVTREEVLSMIVEETMRTAYAPQKDVMTLGVEKKLTKAIQMD